MAWAIYRATNSAKARNISRGRSLAPFFALSWKRHAMRTIAALLLLLLFLPGACSPSSAPEKFFLGFDRNDYPGDDAMKLFRKEFSFTSYWLGKPPGEKYNSWSGKRALLRSQGWGFLPLFNGPTSGEIRDEPYTLKRVSSDTQTAIPSARKEVILLDTGISFELELSVSLT